MPKTPDRRPGESDEEGTLYEVDAIAPSVEGEVRYVAGVGFQMQDLLGVFNPRNGSSSIFGQAYTYAASEPQSDTTSAAYQTKLTLTTPALIAGTYVLVWSAECRTAAANKQMDVRLLLDGATTLAAPSQYPPQGNLWLAMAGIRGGLVLAAGVHTVVVQYKATVAGNTVSIRSARAALWRVL